MSLPRPERLGGELYLAKLKSYGVCVWYRSPTPRGGGGHALQGVTGWQNSEFATPPAVDLDRAHHTFRPLPLKFKKSL